MDNKGYTLIELIVVVVIIGFLITIAVPRLSIYINESRQVQEEANARIIYTVATTLEIATEKGIDYPNNVEFNGEDKTLMGHLNDRLEGLKIAEEPNLTQEIWGITKDGENKVIKNPKGEIILDRK
jgi:prepilin-type N-terminal cleavage/methylation domain-containing protein